MQPSAVARLLEDWPLKVSPDWGTDALFVLAFVLLGASESFDFDFLEDSDFLALAFPVSSGLLHLAITQEGRVNWVSDRTLDNFENLFATYLKQFVWQ